MKKLKINTLIVISLFICFGFSNPKEINKKTLPNKMSSTFLKFISTNPGFIPEKSNEIKAKAFLNSIFKDREVEFVHSDDIEFIDQGANFDKVLCNHCGKEITTENWQHAVDEAYKGHFKNLAFITPCCHKATTLNDLKYHWPAGFAKFQITILDPSGDIKDEQLKELEDIIGTKIRKIWAHY